MNKVTLVGNITKDIELSTTNNDINAQNNNVKRVTQLENQGQ